MSGDKNKYLYNGVELQEDLGLGMYQTLFRLYDPAIGRFVQVDPLAEFLPGINPYNFAFNNPISFGDPDGLAPMWWLKLRAKVKQAVYNVTGRGNQHAVIHGTHKGRHVEIGGKTSGKNNSTPTPRTDKAPSPERNYASVPSVGPKKPDFSTGNSSFPDISVTSVDVPKPSRSILRTEDGDIPIDAGTSIRMNFSPFGGNSSTVNNRGNLSGFLNPIADYLRDNPNMAVTIVVNTQIPQNQLNNIINMNGGTGNGSTRQLLTERGQAIQRALLNLGTDQRQVVYMFNNGADTNRIDIRFRDRE